jgi:hypothetical protein
VVSKWTKMDKIKKVWMYILRCKIGVSTAAAAICGAKFKMDITGRREFMSILKYHNL